MPLPQEFIDLVKSQEFASLRESNDDTSISEAINLKDQPAGWVPPRHVLACILQDKSGIGANLIWVWRHDKNLDGTSPPQLLRGLVAQLFMAAELAQYEFKIPTQDLIDGCDALNAATLKDAIVAGEEKVSRSSQLLGRDCNPLEVEEARKS